MTKPEKFKVGEKTRKHVIQQLSRIERIKKIYDPMLWAMMMLYVVVGTGYPLLDKEMYLVVLLEVIVFLFVTMFIYVKVDKMRQSATEGRIYADIRNNIGTDEIMEQATIKDIFTLVVPADPYPWHAVMIDFDEVEPLFRSIGADVKIKSTTDIQSDMDEYIKTEAKRIVEAKSKKDKDEKDAEKVADKVLKSSIKEKKKAYQEAVARMTEAKAKVDAATPIPETISPRRKLIEKMKVGYENWEELKKEEQYGGTEYIVEEHNGPPLINVQGVSEMTIPKLAKLGITTVEQLANSDPEVVGKIKFMGASRAVKIIENAKKLLEEGGAE
jgi:hypothetical protein